MRADLSGQWIDRVHAKVPPKWITLDMDSSVKRDVEEDKTRILVMERDDEPCKVGLSLDAENGCPLLLGNRDEEIDLSVSLDQLRRIAGSRFGLAVEEGKA